MSTDWYLGWPMAFAEDTTLPLDLSSAECYFYWTLPKEFKYGDGHI